MPVRCVVGSFESAAERFECGIFNAAFRCVSLQSKECGSSRAAGAKAIAQAKESWGTAMLLLGLN